MIKKIIFAGLAAIILAAAFSKLWMTSLLFPQLYLILEVDGNLVYRLSQEEYDEMITLTTNPPAEEMIRALYILVHI